jgi:hypothetical protein
MWPGSRGGIQHTLTARGVSFAKGLWREIIKARIVVVVVGLQKVSRAHGDMMFGMMMLCKIVGAVSRSAPPIDMVLFLPNAVANPIEAHIHGFGSLLFDGFVGDTTGGAVVGNHRSRRLWVAQFVESDAEGGRLLCRCRKGRLIQLPMR